MKLYIPALVAVLAFALTGCGGGGKPAAEATSKPTASATAKQRAIVPDLVGKSALEAKSHLDKLNYRARFFGPDGQSWSAKTQVDDTVLTVSTSPAAGGFSGNDFVDVRVNISEKEFLTGATARAAAKDVADAEANIARRYTYSCGVYGPGHEYKSFEEVWGSGDYKDGGEACEIKILGISPSSKPDLLPSEQKLVDDVAARGVAIKSPGETFGRIMNLCAKLDNTWGATYMDKPTTPESRAEAAVALTICPDAPHAAELQNTVNSPRVADGTMVVGQAMEPGTWKTKPGVKGCYWSRSAGDGTILANDIIDFAPDGVTVTVNAGEGFKSSRCGVWVKIG
ncbi:MULTISPECIES: PASTA domain-containing protein [Paenarthrobacter]|uniref:PASTA domain-containing protein n=1 Tax=Paenarthrobacter ureafaciens TaxID=37931 RepID=A0AAX3EJW8_PAEUR|nr:MULTISPECIES: PASTA domain-containing protein [Paenarthrobacter]NKR12481.1 hypothetical protein [Arthrobacter sp. M5]NKR14312.1 hypothetical protein [Arthrobacter sp. M6]MDO5863411.1 hypothetical protein [Paenarthrobacter sp. SD-2]MDO5874479.1 hypothetical protein [Paenarthrobacter sp. SD-1]UYV93886.1 hypothetical protein NL395_04120 [Paenarthrobacter ureafaciens]